MRVRKTLAAPRLLGNDMSGGEERINVHRHADLLLQIRVHSLQKPIFMSLDLLREMLRWDPNDRISVTEACEYGCWAVFD